MVNIFSLKFTLALAEVLPNFFHVYISQFNHFARVCSINVSDLNNRSKLSISYIYKSIFKKKKKKKKKELYHRYSELILKYDISLKTLLQEGISEPVSSGYLVYKCKPTVLPAKSDSDIMFCLQSYQGLIINRSQVIYGFELA